MDKELRKLILGSVALDDVKKRVYLEVIKHIPDERKRELFQILKKEKKGVERIEYDRYEKISTVDNEYIADVEQLISETDELMKESEEKEKEKKSEELLQKLKDI